MSEREPQQTNLTETGEILIPSITIDFFNLSENTVKVIAAHANAMGCTPNDAAKEILDRISRSTAA